MTPTWIAVPGALAVLFATGDTAVKLIARDSRLLWYERWALKWLFGTGWTTIAWFLLMPLYRWISPLSILTGIALALALYVRRRSAIATGSRVPAPGLDSWNAALTLVLLLQFVALVVAAMWTPLGWDGLFNFELKARLAFEHTPVGRLPSSYFSDVTRDWSHPGYPPLVPFTEFWIYSWLGRIDQSAIKVVFPLFYLSLTALICGAVRRLANVRAALVAGIALGCLPALTILPGAVSGYADVPLAASVGGAACFAFLALRTHDPRHVNIAAALLVVAVWTKSEGFVLAGAIGVAALAAAETIDRGRLAALLWMPAAALAPWHATLAMHGVPPAVDFGAVTPDGVAGAFEAFALISSLVARELARAGHWGLIWPCFFLTVLFMIAAKRSSRADWFLAGAVLVPLAAYACAYLFSAWPDVSEHVRLSLPRLLVPIAPLALVLIIRRAGDDLGVEATEWA